MFVFYSETTGFCFFYQLTGNDLDQGFWYQTFSRGSPKSLHLSDQFIKSNVQMLQVE